MSVLDHLMTFFSSKRMFLVGWVVIHIMAITMFLSPRSGFFALLLFGYIQKYYLEHTLEMKLPRWQWLTLLGGVLGIMPLLVFVALQPAFIGENFVVDLALSVLLAIVFFMAVSIAQWLVLKKIVYRANQWIVGNAIAGAMFGLGGGAIIVMGNQSAFAFGALLTTFALVFYLTGNTIWLLLKNNQIT